MTRTDLISAVAEQTGFTKKDAKTVVVAAFDAIIKALEEGDRVAITDFGTFKVVERDARTMRNPSTGGTIEVPAHGVVKFVATSNLKSAVR